MKENKFHFHGILNYHSIDIELWRWAINKDEALNLYCAEIARRSHTSVRRVVNYFLRTGRYIIQEMR